MNATPLDPGPTGLVEPRVQHVVVGPDEHGVVRHGVQVARACAQPLLRGSAPDPGALDPDALGRGAVEIVHLPFTDRLFAPRCEDAAAAFAALIAPARARGLSVSVTLHDLPADDSPLERRRRAAYEAVVGLADGVVVNSARELELVGRLTETARSLRLIPLPVTQVEMPSPRPPALDTSDADVVVLGFLFPDRGYEQVIAALPAGVGLTALGRPSAGHEDLPDRWAALAAASGHPMLTTGFVADDDLPAQLWAARVPVAPNRRVAASGSIGTWIGHGRRPLVPATPYTRELDRRWPGTLTLYDADDPRGLAAAIVRALAESATTWLEPDTPRGPSLAEVAAAYRRHFLGCGPPAAVRVGPRSWTVPGNRWDLVPREPTADVTVSVVVPYHQAQARLDLVLTALSLQDHRGLEVVVADDGSPDAPTVAAADGLPVTVVRQHRDGFRAAAARNLGAAAASGEVLLFLDGDTLPEPGYVTAMLALPAACPDAVVVGRRRHADLAGWTPDAVRRWLGGAGPGGADHRAPNELPEPVWLAEGYTATADLLNSDDRSYRYVISAVCGLQRDLFAEVGGFSEEFNRYGGEDWELAHRLWTAGAVLAHRPDAVAWHDGPDWAGRPQARAGGKNAETLTLSRLLPDPEARGGGSFVEFPATVLVLAFVEPAAVLATARAAFAHDTDVGVWLAGEPGPAGETVALLADPRVHAGPVPSAVLGRARAVVTLSEPARLLDLDADVATAARYGPTVSPVSTVTPSRITARSRRWSAATSQTALALRLFGGRDVLGPTPTSPVDLAHELTLVRRASRR